jgi:hypothetical protein
MLPEADYLYTHRRELRLDRLTRGHPNESRHGNYSKREYHLRWW